MLCRARGIAISVHKLAAHRTEDHVAAGLISLASYFDNFIADKLSGHAAEKKG